MMRSRSPRSRTSVKSGSPISESANKMDIFLEEWPYPDCSRSDITLFVSLNDFGQRLCGRNSSKIALYNRVKECCVSSQYEKRSDVASSLWSLPWDWHWMKAVPINLRFRCERSNFFCEPDVYKHYNLRPHGLMVDFANSHVGGGCFTKGWVQEEQMVVQSTDFATILQWHRQWLWPNESIHYQGIHMDVWWSRTVASKKTKPEVSEMQRCDPKPLTILAVHAPRLNRHGVQYLQFHEITHLAAQIALIYGVADRLQSKEIYTGLLGGGAYRNNRPLILVLHLVLQPIQQTDTMLFFHHPIFSVFGNAHSCHELETRLLTKADRMLKDLRLAKVATLYDVVCTVHGWRLKSAHNDADLDCPTSTEA